MWSAFSALFAMLVIGCGSADAPTSPTSPSKTFTLSGVVRDARSNEPLTGAQVEIVSGPDAGRSTAGSASGNFSFAAIQPGAVVLRVAVDGYIAVDRSIEVTANTVIDVTLTPAPKPVVPLPEEPPSPPQPRTVSGQVTDKPVGGGIAGARVEILSGVNRGKFVETDGNGNYQFADVASEQQVQIRAYKIGYFLVDRNVGIGKVNVQGVDFTLERRRLTLTGTMQFKGGVTTLGSRVELIDGPDRGKASNTDPADRYLLDRITWGPHRIRITNDCIDTLEMPFPIPNDSPWLGDTMTNHFVVALKSATLTGTITEFPRQVLSAGASVTLQTREGRRIEARVTGADGRYSFTGLCGYFQLIVEKSDFNRADDWPTVFSNTVKDVQLGERRFRLYVSDFRYAAPGATARVMTGPYAGQSCTTYQNSDRDDPPHCTMDFRGPATVRVSKPGYVSQDFSIDLQFDRSLPFALTKLP